VSIRYRESWCQKPSKKLFLKKPSFHLPKDKNPSKWRKSFQWNITAPTRMEKKFIDLPAEQDHKTIPEHQIAYWNSGVSGNQKTIFQHFTNHQRIYTHCYLIVPKSHRREYIMVLPHMLIHRDFTEPLRNCTQCNQTMMRIRPVNECGNCIETFWKTDEANLNRGWGTAVFPLRREE